MWYVCIFIYILILFYLSFLETQVSFEKTEYTGSEADGFVEVTLKLSKPIVFKSSLQLEASDFTTIGELYNMCMCNQLFFTY